jgi:hypothetical protein
MHAHGEDLVATEEHRLKAGTRVSAVVVCHHVFGLGVYVADADQYGHVDIVSIAAPGVPLRGPEDFPPVDSNVDGVVLGYAGRDAQLRLRLVV